MVWSTLQNITRETSFLAVLVEISNFYEDSNTALEILKNHFAFDGDFENFNPTPLAVHLLRRERILYGKRLVYGVARKVHLLEIALDESNVRTPRGGSLGLPAYQAERFYTGK